MVRVHQVWFVNSFRIGIPKENVINQYGLAHVTVTWNVTFLPDLISGPLPWEARARAARVQTAGEDLWWVVGGARTNSELPQAGFP